MFRGLAATRFFLTVLTAINSGEAQTVTPKNPLRLSAAPVFCAKAQSSLDRALLPRKPAMTMCIPAAKSMYVCVASRLCKSAIGGNRCTAGGTPKAAKTQITPTSMENALPLFFVCHCI